jgi:co-chaperonin GroES (HSP10)
MIHPVGHRVLVKKMKVEERDPVFKSAVKAGLALPDHDDLRRREAGVDRGHVVSIGSDAWKQFYANANPGDTYLVNFKPWCKVGDFVAFAKYGGMPLKDADGNEYIMINDEDVVAVLEGFNDE